MVVHLAALAGVRPSIAAPLRYGEVNVIGTQRVLEACARTVASDGILRTREAELLRAMADTLDCPIPPFIELPPA